MQNFGARARVAVVSSMVLAGACVAYACTPDDENPGSTRTFDGGSETGSTIDPQGADAQLGAPICAKYGGYTNVKAIAAAITARVANDCRISAPIAGLDANGTQHLAECFEIQIGGAFQCPGITYVSNTTTDSKGDKCRDMSQAHRGLNLRNADFNAFVEDIAAELSAKGVTQDDIRSIAPVFEGTRTGVVQTNSQPDKNTFCTCPNGEYMGKSCVVEAGPVDSGTLDSGTADAMDAADGGG